MKKAILFLGLIFFACTPGDVETPKITVANKVTEMRTLIIDYNKITTIRDSGYQRHSVTFYSNNQNDCGLKLQGYETSQVGTLNGVKVQITTSFRFFVECN